MPSIHVPKYRHHKSTGRAVVTLGGRDIYLGDYGSADSKARYARLLAEYAADGQVTPSPDDDLTVCEIIARFWEHAQRVYSAGELFNFRSAMRILNTLYGQEPARMIGPRAMRAIQVAMVGEGWKRTGVNKQMGRLKHVFKWAAARELVPATVYHGMLTLEGLRRGRTDAPESDPIHPVPQPMIDAVLPLVSRQVAAMIRLQLLTGTRAGEFCQLRTADLDTAGKVWIYRPDKHKTAHHGHTREIWIGPKAQQVLKPFLKTDLQAFIFSPADAEAERHEEQRRQRQSPVQPSQVERAVRSARRQQERAPGDCFTVNAYRRAIQRACEQAFPPPGHLRRHKGESPMAHRARLTTAQRQELKAWQKAHRWHPHQLRHNAGTFLRKEYGIEVARLILGHRSAAVTEIYAEVDRTKAAQIMERVG